MALHQKLQTAATTGNGVEKTFKGGPRELTFFVTGSSGVASGAVQPEEAPFAGYTGTWAPIGSPVTVTADTTKTARITGAFSAVRARISTTVAGGTVDVDLFGTQDEPA